MSKELHNRVEQTLKILGETQSAKANPFLYQKIMHKIKDRQTSTEPVISQNVLIRWSVVGLFLLAVNLFTWLNDPGSSEKTQNSAAQLMIDEYGFSQSSGY